ncbi:hypothetical protein BP6252_09226 [Coleophoma cylindrospora]|uniref:CUE domain-containing protein n=1 Tax=Coleophoma cylindrospora TaxID=1849047 RepID=A0A3D8R1L0_9HELO|nr:hypothetical protein BP6252_09226 [Coleophoma cylindrospora]
MGFQRLRTTFTTPQNSLSASSKVAPSPFPTPAADQSDSESSVDTDDMVDDDEREEVDTLKNMFPKVRIRTIRDVLVAQNGDQTKAASVLANMPVEEKSKGRQALIPGTSSISSTSTKSTRNPVLTPNICLREKTERRQVLISGTSSISPTSTKSAPVLTPNICLREKTEGRQRLMSGIFSISPTSTKSTKNPVLTPNTCLGKKTKGRHASMSGISSISSTSTKSTENPVVTPNIRPTTREKPDSPNIKHVACPEPIPGEIIEISDDDVFFVKTVATGVRQNLDTSVNQGDPSVCKVEDTNENAVTRYGLPSEAALPRCRRVIEIEDDDAESVCNTMQARPFLVKDEDQTPIVNESSQMEWDAYASRRRNSLKRSGSPVRSERAMKKTRVEDIKAAAALMPATAWVLKHLNHTADRVNILLVDSISRRNVPKALLKDASIVFTEMLNKLPKYLFETPELRIDGVKDHIFDMVLQWLVTKNVTPVPLYATIVEEQITTYLDFALSVDRFKINGPSLMVEERLKKLLCEFRSAMKGKHIVKAFELSEGHLIRKLFVKALVQPYIESKPAGSDSPEHLTANDLERFKGSVSSSGMDTEEEMQRKIAFGAKFPFRNEVRSIEGLEADLNSMVVTTYSTIERKKRPRSRVLRCYLVDPLTEKQFEMP